MKLSLYFTSQSVARLEYVLLRLMYVFIVNPKSDRSLREAEWDRKLRVIWETTLKDKESSSTPQLKT